MTVEERKWSMGREGGPKDQFPVGLRVLAVDDDPICLRLLEALLLQCQYQVTTTNQAIMALKMLRENKDKFDLVISDVHMPDMDGFKLLELVGLEMDLPVIMLSANGETKAVMKGIAHGACDYLLKPVRIEELRNIWQHVVRRRKFDSKDHNNYDNGDDSDKAQQGQTTGGSSDHGGKLNRKRKDQNEDDEDDGQENMHENEELSTQKKPRVVWSVELHRKFVAAVNQLGIDKAVPKRILDLMNVEKLTRENVASHLQKYRLYLKRLSAVASQQANMVAAFGGRDPSSLHIGSLDGYGNFHALAASGQLPALSSFQTNGVLSRTNPAGYGLRGFATSGIVQPEHTHCNTNNPINDLSKLQHISLPGSQHGKLLQGMPTTLELDQLQQHKRMQEASIHLPGGFSGARLATGSSSNSFVNVTNSPLLSQAYRQHTQSKGLGNHSSVGIPSMSSDPFHMSVGGSSHLPDLGRCNDTWQDAVPLTSYTSNTLSMNAPFHHNDLANMGASVPVVSHIDRNRLNISSSSVVAAPPHDAVTGRLVQCQASSLGGNTMLMPSAIEEDSKFLNFGSAGTTKQKSKEANQDHIHEPNLIFNSYSNSSLSSKLIVDSIAENQRLNNGYLSKKLDINGVGQTNFIAPVPEQNCKIDKSTTNIQPTFKEDSTLEISKSLGGFNSSGCSFFDDLVNSMIKPDKDDIAFMDGDIGCDFYPLGACM